jgi:hypothetical protein
MDVCTPLVEDVPELAARAAEQGSVIAFQSSLAAAATVVDRALHREAAAEEAALSLAQQDALRAMSDELRAISGALHDALDSQGRCLMPGAEKKRRAFRLPASRKEKATPRPTWWYSLVEAIEALGEGSERMRAIASGQPGEAPSCVLSQATADLLGSHHDRLVSEAERWID